MVFNDKRFAIPSSFQ